jgi:hypothetical protein
VPQVAAAAGQIQGPALFAGGTLDPTYDPAVVSQLRAKPDAEVLLVEGGNHSLDIPGDPVASLHALADVIQAVSALLPLRN